MEIATAGLKQKRDIEKHLHHLKVQIQNRLKYITKSSDFNSTLIPSPPPLIQLKSTMWRVCITERERHRSGPRLCYLDKIKTNFAKLSKGDEPGYMETFSTKYRPIYQSKGDSKRQNTREQKHYQSLTRDL